MFYCKCLLSWTHFSKEENTESSRSCSFEVFKLQEFSSRKNSVILNYAKGTSLLVVVS